MKRIIFGLLLLVLVSCSSAPSEGAVQTAIAQTAALQPSPTYTPFLTETPAPTETSTPAPTSTQTPTPTETLTPTPTDAPTATPDLRIILIDAREFLLEKEDLPIESKYYLPGTAWISPHHNEEILTSWGIDEGRAYLEETGRIDGWWVYYKRGSNVIAAPEEIFHNIIQYETALGAQITATKYNLAERAPEEGWVLLDDEVNLGDLSVVMVTKETQSNGKNRVWLRIETAYRNYLSVLQEYGWEEEVRLEYLVEVQRMIVEKLAAAELVTP